MDVRKDAMSTQEAIIRTENVTKGFGALRAVNQVNYSLKHNEIAAIIGPNGAGKTTFFNLITGFYLPDEGAVFYEGQDITKLAPRYRVKLGIRRTFQLASTFDNLRVIDNIRLAYFNVCGGSSLASMFSTRAASLNDERIEQCLEKFGFSQFANTETRNLPLGNKRRLEIAMALIGEPKVLLLDEPFAGLSETEITEVIEVLQGCVGKMAILLVEHKVTKLKGLVDRIGVLVNGELIADGPYEEVLEAPQVLKSYWQVG